MNTSVLMAGLLAVRLATAITPAAPVAQTLQSQVPRPAASITLVRVTYDAQGGTKSMGNATLSEDFTAYIYTTNGLCGIGGVSVQRPSDAAFGWEVKGHFVSRTPAEVVVQLDWRRAWDGGQASTAPGGSMSLALHPGDRVPIDHITTEAAGPCQSVGMTLNVGFNSPGSTSSVSVAPSAGGISGGGGGGRSSGVPLVGVGRGAGVGAGGVANVGSGRAGAGSGVSGGGGGFSGGGGGFVNTSVVPYTGGTADERTAMVRRMLEQGERPDVRDPSGHASAGFVSPGGSSVNARSNFDPQTLQTITVDLWLVERLQNGSETSQYRSVQTTPGDGAFAFDPVILSLTEGTYGVQVKGFLQAQRTTDGSAKLEVGLLRRVSVLTAAPEGATPPSLLRMISGGSSTGSIPVPQPGQVISFEMPAPQNDAITLGGHQFSLRIRVAR